MNLSERWLPESLRGLGSYTRTDFGAAKLAGLTVGMVALPRAMAFAFASGVSPQVRLYTAIVAGGLISALGGSRMQIGGPTGAFVVLAAGIVGILGGSGPGVVKMMGRG